MKKTTTWIVFVMFLFLACKRDAIIATKTENTTTSQPENPAPLANAKYAGYSYWYFFRGESSPTLRYAYSNNGTTWGGNVAFNNNPQSNTGPAAAYFNGKFVVACRGNNTTNLFVSYSYTGTTWYGNTQIVGQTGSSPSLVVYNNQLYLFYSGDSGNDIWFNVSNDGISWSNPVKIPTTNISVVATGSVTATVSTVGNMLFIYYYTQSGSESYLHYVFNTTIGGDADDLIFAGGHKIYSPIDCPNIVTAAQTVVGPAVAELNGVTYVAYVDKSTFEIKIAKMTDVTCSGWIIYNTGLYSSNRIGFTSLNGRLTLVYKALSSTSIYQAYSLDGSYWQGNSLAIGQTNNGGPVLISN
jgi:hypothetical protein